MFERILNKEYRLTENEINEYIGKKAKKHIGIIKSNLERLYKVTYELKFPFGNKYGWGYNVCIKSKHLLYIFFEKNIFTITIQLKAMNTEYAKSKYKELSNKGKGYWKNRYPCRKVGGWIHYRVLNNKNLLDIGNFIMIKMKKEMEWKV